MRAGPDGCAAASFCNIVEKDHRRDAERTGKDLVSVFLYRVVDMGAGRLPWGLRREDINGQSTTRCFGAIEWIAAKFGGGLQEIIGIAGDDLRAVVALGVIAVGPSRAVIGLSLHAIPHRLFGRVGDIVRN